MALSIAVLQFSIYRYFLRNPLLFRVLYSHRFNFTTPIERLFPRHKPHMDLDVVGRHALFFDDDASAVFVNSGDALVEWHSLQIDRYDVRHLLSAPPPPRRRNRNSERLLFDDPSLESLLDQERYFDLPLDSDQPGITSNSLLRAFLFFFVSCYFECLIYLLLVSILLYFVSFM